MLQQSAVHQEAATEAAAEAAELRERNQAMEQQLQDLKKESTCARQQAEAELVARRTEVTVLGCVSVCLIKYLALLAVLWNTSRCALAAAVGAWDSRSGMLLPCKVLTPAWLCISCMLLEASCISVQLCLRLCCMACDAVVWSAKLPALSVT